jgi:amino acid transporter
MAKLSYKVSYYVFYVCIALILVVLGMFFGVGYNETNAAGLVEPANTPALMYLMYGMFAVTVVATLIGAIAQFGGALKDNPKGAVKSLLGLILLVVLLIVTYNVGSSETVVLGDGSEYSDATMLKVTDMFLYSTYVLFAIAAIGALVNLSGIFKR